MAFSQDEKLKMSCPKEEAWGNLEGYMKQLITDLFSVVHWVPTMWWVLQEADEYTDRSLSGEGLTG